MKYNLVVLLTILSTITSCAQKKETFDIATYKAPKGWQKSVKEGLVSYTTTNEAKGVYCIITIYASRPTTGTAAEEFTNQWNEFAAIPFGITDVPVQDPDKDTDGREVIVGSGTFQRNSLSGYAILTTFVGFGRTTSVLTLTNTDEYQKNVEDFLAAFDLKKTESDIANNDTNNNTPSVSGNTFHHSNKLEGVWMTLHLQSMYYDIASSGDPQWLTFFDNGRVYESLPDVMSNFDKNSSKLGIYQISGNNASLQWFTGTSPTQIDIKDQNNIEVHLGSGNDGYHRCKPVDGARLEGSWTSYSNPNDPSLDNPQFRGPLITFSRDGGFTDFGIFDLLDIAYPANQRTPPGSGTYQLNNFTLILKYDNGTVKPVSVTALLSSDINTQNNSIYLHKTKFNKRRG